LPAIPLEIEEIGAPEALEALRSEWSCLWERCPAATPFQSPEWLLPWWRHLFGGGRSMLLAFRCGTRMVGLAPLFSHVSGCKPPVRRLVLAGSAISDYQDVMLEPECAVEGARQIFERLSARGTEWDLCDFMELRAGSPLLSTAPPPALRRTVLACCPCPVLKLPDSPEAFQASLRPQVRTALRRARNRLERAGARLETATAATLDEHLAALFRLHAARWHERHERGVLSGERVRRFHHEAAGGFLARGILRLHGLRYEGALAASFYGFSWRGRTYGYLTGFDPALARLSPGTVLVALAIERAIAEGDHEFDFLRKAESYKADWNAVGRLNRRLILRWC
jgi:CelD/BcsL family acetyltransferase involved in cellulose biosynthesis